MKETPQLVNSKLGLQEALGKDPSSSNKEELMIHATSGLLYRERYLSLSEQVRWRQDPLKGFNEGDRAVIMLGFFIAAERMKKLWPTEVEAGTEYPSKITIVLPLKLE